MQGVYGRRTDAGLAMQGMDVEQRGQTLGFQTEQNQLELEEEKRKNEEKWKLAGMVAGMGGGGMSAMSDKRSKETISRLEAELDLLKRDRAVGQSQDVFRNSVNRSKVGEPAKAGGMSSAAAAVREGGRRRTAGEYSDEERRNLGEALRVVYAASRQSEADKDYAMWTGMAPYPDEVRQQVANARTPQGQGREMPHAERYDRVPDMERASNTVRTAPEAVNWYLRDQRSRVPDWVPVNDMAAQAGLADAGMNAMRSQSPQTYYSNVPSDTRLKEIDRQLGDGRQMPAPSSGNQAFREIDRQLGDGRQMPAPSSGNRALDREAAIAEALNAEDEYVRRETDKILRGGIRTEGATGGMDERTRLQYAQGAQNDAPWRYRPEAQQAMGLDNKTHYGVSDAERLANSGPVGRSVTERGPDGLWRIDGGQMASANAAMLSEHEKELQRLKDQIMRGGTQTGNYDTPERRQALENMTYGR
jgi:hypothetical protein